MNHLFTDETDTVIAASKKDADKVWEYYIGDPHEIRDCPWEQIDDESDFSVLFEEWGGLPETLDTNVPPSATIVKLEEPEDAFQYRITAKAKDWAKANKKCFLCSTEY